MDLFARESLLNFWPSPKQSKVEQVNSAARFIIYGTLLTYAIKQNVRILVVGIVILAALFFFSRTVLPGGPNADPPCSSFNPDDPLGNLEYTKCYRPKEVQWWSNMAFTSDRRNAERNWYTVPTNELSTHLDFVHGGKNKPFCRQDQSACIADTNPRFMDQPQRRAMRSGPAGFF